MEKLLGTTIIHKSKHLTLAEFLDDYSFSSEAAYFLTDPSGVIFITASNPTHNQQKQTDIINHMNEFVNLHSHYIKKIDQHGIFYHDGHPYTYAIFNKLKVEDTIRNRKKWLSQGNILELAQFLFECILALKKNRQYFGGFFPTRIFNASQEKFFEIIGGESSQKSQISFEHCHQKIVSYDYLAPELIDNSSKFQITYKADLFSVCCILYELANRKLPFSSKCNLKCLHIETNEDSSESLMVLYLVQKVLTVEDPRERTEPEEILEFVRNEKNNLLFQTHKNINLLINRSSSKPGSGFFQNVQDFFIKCTKQTEGWVLHYCENISYAPDPKYLQLILTKINKKSQKTVKLISTIERICSSCAFQKLQKNQTELYNDKENTPSLEHQQNIFVGLKLGMMILNIVRNTGYDSLCVYEEPFRKLAENLLEKKPSHELLIMLLKAIRMKTMLHEKLGLYAGNFYINVSDFSKISLQNIQYLAQYLLKLITYLGKYTQQSDEKKMLPVEKKSFQLICDELYDGTSALILTFMAIRKDATLHLRQKLPQQYENRILKNCHKLLSQIQELSSQSYHISLHSLYSILSDPYEYQEEIYLMYEPILSSYEYFYIDNPKFKGLKVPENLYHKYRGIIDEEKQMFKHRVLIQEKKSEVKKVASSIKQKSKTNNHKLEFEQQFQFEGEIMKSQGSKIGKSSIIQPINNNQTTLDPFDHFPQSLQYLQPYNTNENKTNRSERTTPSDCKKSNSDEQEFDFLNSDIHSYQWLKKTEKIIPKLFKKPQLDATIHFLYDQICKGLKLQELIEFLGKNKKFIVDPSKVLFQKVIGSGSAGEVYIGKYHQEVVAIKKVKTQTNPAALKEFEREVLTYLKIKNHPFLVSLVGLTKFNQDYFLLTQFCEGGSLFDLLHKKVNEIPLDWPSRLKLILETAKGMKFLHDMNPPIIHRDLKSLNIFIKKVDGLWTAKVADFGLSRTPDANLMTSALGTLHWMAPELLCNKQYSLKVDIYSFSIVMWEICARKTPYHNLKSPMEIVKHVVTEKGRPIIDLVGEGCPRELIELMKKCWSQQAQKRPLFGEIIEILQKIALY